jgi:hypothetical protein
MLNINRDSAAAKAVIAHRDNIRKNLERRMEVARAKGDTTLLKILEAEANALK